MKNKRADEKSASPTTRMRRPKSKSGLAAVEATAILVAHPGDKLVGSRFAIAPGGVLEIGRFEQADISLPDVPSVSRLHARLVHSGPHVVIEDLGSTNGTWVNDGPVRETAVLRSGDRFQVGAVHFKLLHEVDVEHAYRAALAETMVRDGLTQAWNRERFHEEAHREFARALRYARPFCLILMDLDEFKQVNERRGLLGGDSVLRRTAATVMPLVRGEQLFARIGGEKFGLLCPEVPIAGATILADRLREAVAGIEHRNAGSAFKVTCSMGVASFSDQMERFDELYETAARALQRSKQKGRNRVTVASSADSAAGEPA
jgi:two-component system cell cycle response regulator